MAAQTYQMAVSDILLGLVHEALEYATPGIVPLSSSKPVLLFLSYLWLSTINDLYIWQQLHCRTTH